MGKERPLCALCGTPIDGKGRKVWTQLVTAGMAAPIRWQLAHQGCAALLEAEFQSDYQERWLKEGGTVA